MGTNSYIGKTIGNYRILAELGSGSFGVVYRCEHVFLQNRVGAIKLMHASHLDAQEERDNFLREARLLEMLKHPHILPILDVGIHEGFPYLVTEYAPPGSLRDRLQRIDPRLLPMEESLKILSQIGLALDHAHAQNIIHRDLKPANILFNAQGDALLADFGIATTLATASIKFVEASGSPPYMAPEQFQGTISKESDQYALACIAYELLTGHRPFSAPDPFTLGYKHLTETPVPPKQYNPAIPAYIEQAILKAMAKERMERFPNVAAFIAALRPLQLYQRPPAMEARPITGGSTVVASQFMPTLPNNAPGLVPGGIPTPAPASQFPPLPSGPISRSEEVMWMQSGLTVQATGPAMPTPVPTQRDMPTLPAQQYANMNPPAPYPVASPPTPPPFTQPAYGQTPPPPPGIQPAYRQAAAPPSSFPAPASAGQMLGPGAGPAQTTTQQAPRKRRRWPLVLAAILVLLLILGPGGVAAFYTFAYPATATVTITPLNRDLKNTFTITQVTKNPNTSLNQVTGARLITATKSKTTSATATGIAHTSATVAYGTLVLENDDSSNGYIYSTNVGQTLTSNNGISVIIDSYVQVYPQKTGTFRAHMVKAGASGNIGPHVFYYSYNDGYGGLKVYNTQSFVGGKDAGTYTVVQQGDINGAANPLMPSVLAEAQQAYGAELKAGEQEVGAPKCGSKVTADKNVGDAASTFNVTVSFSCSGEVYDPTAPEAAASEMLKAQASSDLDPSYVLAGNILTTILSVSVTNVKTGTLSLVIATEGIWNFNFSTTQKLALAKLIAGKSVQDAQAVLAQQNGVKSALVNLAGTFLFWNSVPTNIDHITISIKQVSVPEPQVSPTPGASPANQPATVTATP
ncbi:MAG TPA: protein kinase [Ktedonobacteraceae bacterium]|nr:protein kinase [Ktedonobacteraceae bacterium]